MNETEIIDGLRGVALAEPLLGFDPDDVATRAARRLRARRAMLGSGLAVAAAAGVAVTVAASTSGPAQTGASPSGGHPSSAAPPAKHPDLTEKMLRLQAHLQQTLPAMVPGAKDIEVGPFEQGYPNEDDGWDLVTSEVTFRDDAGPATFNLTVTGTTAGRKLMSPIDRVCTDPALRPDGKPLRCEKKPQQDGSTVLLREDGSGYPGSRVVTTISGLDAFLYRTDGTTVNVLNNELVPGVLAARYGIEPGLRSRFPLTEQQVVALVTDPAFSLR
jgi:hypothetical protein